MLPVSTIYVVGFPLEVYPRDLKNFCRFLPGFVDAHVPSCSPSEPPVLFAKFLTCADAQAALQRIHCQPFDLDRPQLLLNAELARRDLEVRQGASTPPPVVATVGRGFIPPGQPQVIHGGYKRPLPATEDEIVTITVLGTRDKGYSTESLQEWFGQFPGCVALQVNEKLDGIFSKFASRREAEFAMSEATRLNLGAEWARRNLDEGGAPPMAAVPAPMAPPQTVPQVIHGVLEPPWKRPHVVDGGELTTITVLGMRDKGIQPHDLESWFRTRRGFLALQANGRLDGIFAKFDTVSNAEKALQEANNRQYRAEWARRNLDGGAKTPERAPAPAGNPNELNTITVLGMRDKGYMLDDLQQWFAQRRGYQAMKVNDRIDGLFVKFNSAAEAAQALQEANDSQIRAEWARRNLDN